MRKTVVLVLLSFLVASAAWAQTEITYWVPTDLSTIDREFIREIVDAFNQANTDVAVTMVEVPGTETDVARLMTAVRGGTGPDVYHLDRFTVAQRAADGVLQDLTPMLEEEGVDLSAEYVDFAWQEVLFQDRVYALPFDTDVRAVYYNRDMLREVGVDPAVLDAANGPITIDTFKEIAAQVDLKDDTGAYTRLGFVPWFDQGWHYSWGFAFGGSFYDAAACEVTPTDAGVVAGFQFLYDWAAALGPQEASAFLSTYAPPQNPPAQHPFVTGHLAMVLTGDWFVTTLEQFAPDMDWGVTYMPTPAGEESSWSGGWSAVIPQGAAHPAEAYRFVRYLTGLEGQTMYLGSNHLPTWQSLLADPSALPASYTFFLSLLPASHSRPALPVGALYWDELTAAQEAVTLNQAMPEAALQQVYDRVQPQLAGFCPN